MNEIISCKRSEILQNLNWQCLSIPAIELIENFSRQIDLQIKEWTFNWRSFWIASHKLILLLQLWVWKEIEEIIFKLTKNISKKSLQKSTADEIMITQSNTDSYQPLEICIPFEELVSDNDDELIKLPDTFRWEVNFTSIWLMWNLQIGTKKINITDYNY